MLFMLSENRRHSHAHVLAQVHKLKGFGLHVVNMLTDFYLPSLSPLVNTLPHILMLNDASTVTLTFYRSKIFLVLVLRWEYTLY